MPQQSPTDQALRTENAELRARLEVAEEMLRAMRAGEVDALVVESDGGPQLFTLQGLDAEQNRFRGEILEQVSDAVIAMDLEERFTFLNAAAERQYGVRASAVLGRQRGEIFTMYWPSPEQEAAAWAALREHGQWHGEYLQRTHQGRELHVDSTLTALRDSHGEIIGHLAVVRDITERKRAEEALRESEERKHLATTATGVGIWEWNVFTNQIRWNAEMFRIYGIAPTPDGIIPYSTWSETVLPEDLPGQEAVLQDTVCRSGQSSREFRICRADDHELRHIQSTETVRANAHRQSEWVVGTNLDITDRTQKEQALHASEERFRVFAGQLEHLVKERTEELVQSQVRLRAFATELNLAEHRERKRLADELHDYLAQLLVLCRLNLGQIKLIGLPTKVEKKVRDTEEVLTQALHYCRTLMAELSPPVLQEHGLSAALRWFGEQMAHRGLTVRVDVGGAAEVRLPEDTGVLLFQSARELLLNALKYAECHEVAVRMEQADGRLRLEICDDGVGFDPDAVDSYSPTAMSSKFGLFSIRERMRSMGGWFDLTSSLGKGTTATLVLPLGKASAAECGTRNEELEISGKGTKVGNQSSGQSTVQQNTNRIRVLLVDDHAMVRQGLKSVLDGYADIEVVGEALDGEAAIAAAERLRPAIVVMDINMPKKNGIEATAYIKARHPEIIVIGMSVQAGGANEEAMKKAGASMLLPKEAAVDELYRAIHHTLAAQVMSGDLAQR